jgi:predicted Zn-ribbon and HTH transcriptional regulator
VSATLQQRHRLVIPLDLLQWADELVRQTYRARLERAGLPECGLCFHRNDPTRANCERCHALLSDESAPCLSCGRESDEHAIEQARGYCPHCSARWVGTSEREPVLVPYALPAGDEDAELPV